jgi:hypothetical protein
MARQSYEPIPETVPEIPPRHPIFLVDIRRVSAHGVVVSCRLPSIVDKRQYLSMLCGLGYLIPLVWRPSSTHS